VIDYVTTRGTFAPLDALLGVGDDCGIGVAKVAIIAAKFSNTT